MIVLKNKKCCYYTFASSCAYYHDTSITKLKRESNNLIPHILKSVNKAETKINGQW